VKRIAITGPESTGKSRLASELARYCQDVFVPEYAREYIAQLDRPYTREDILAIAKGQLKTESDLAGQARRFLFCDTDLIVTKIWSLHKFGTCDPFILENIEKHRYDLYLLCDIDLPWEPDAQREHPDLRQFFFDWYKRELEDYGFPFAVVRGQAAERLQHAVDALQAHFPGLFENDMRHQ
jgi:NadR type nicotinamide-nucleotide adenylyltransferase